MSKRRFDRTCTRTLEGVYWEIHLLEVRVESLEMQNRALKQQKESLEKELQEIYHAVDKMGKKGFAKIAKEILKARHEKQSALLKRLKERIDAGRDAQKQRQSES